MTSAEALAELERREPLFHRPEFGGSRAAFASMMAENFWETGASGRMYSREFVLDELDRRLTSPQKEEWQTSDFRCRELAAGLFLLTYTLLQDGVRWTRRTTIWRHSAAGWQAEYHQGTLIKVPSAIGEDRLSPG